MLVSLKPDLDDRIVHLVAHHRPLRASEILLALHGQVSKLSLAAVYKSLRRLRKQGVIIKAGNVFYISSSWLSDLRSLLAHAVQSAEFEPNQLLLPLPGQRRNWRFSNLQHMNDFASQLIVLAAKGSNSRQLYSWNPHPWFYLVQAQHEDRYLRTLNRRQRTMFKIVGGTTFLDYWTKRFWSALPIEVRFLEQSKLFSSRLYFVVAKPYIVTMRIDPFTARRIDAFYTGTQTEHTVNLELFLNIFRNNKVRCAVGIVSDENKSDRLAKKFALEFSTQQSRCFDKRSKRPRTSRQR